MLIPITSFTSVLLVSLTPVATLQNQDEGRWKPIASGTKLAARSECGLATVEGKIYLLGGDGPVVPVEAFDPMTSTGRLERAHP